MGGLHPHGTTLEGGKQWSDFPHLRLTLIWSQTIPECRSTETGAGLKVTLLLQRLLQTRFSRLSVMKSILFLPGHERRVARPLRRSEGWGRTPGGAWRRWENTSGGRSQTDGGCRAGRVSRRAPAAPINISHLLNELNMHVNRFRKISISPETTSAASGGWWWGGVTADAVLHPTHSVKQLSEVC